MSEGVVVKLKSIYPSLSEVERKVADYIIRNYDKVPYQSISEIAETIGVSLPSITRVAKKIGYENFREFKVSLAKDEASSLNYLYSSIAKDDSDDVIVEKVFIGNMKTLEDTLKVLGKPQLINLAQKIVSAKRVVFFGIGSSSFVAAEAALRFSHLDVQAEACADPIQILLQAKRLTQGCIAVGISHSGRTRIVCDAIKTSKDNQAATCMITNYINAPIKEHCDYFFCTAHPESEVKAAALSSMLAQIALIDALYLLTARYKKHIWDIEALNQMFDKTLRNKL